MRRFALAFLCVWFGLGVSPPPAQAVVLGDFNDDGLIDLLDFAVLQLQFNGRACARGEFEADLDDDGCVDLLDYLTMYVSLGGAGCSNEAQCGIQSSDDCFWKPIADARAANQCNNMAMLPDPVDRRLCQLNILVNGSVDDALLAGALALVDTVADEAGNPPTFPVPPEVPVFRGDGESPRFPTKPDPNGFNISRAVLLFVQDSNTLDDIDDSFLYLGWDISDHVDEDGIKPRPFDSDDNNLAAALDTCVTGCAVSDRLGESYQVFIQSCADAAVFDPVTGPGILMAPNPQQVIDDNDSSVLFQKAIGCSNPLETIISPPTQSTTAFPTADDATNLSNECIDLEIDNCAAGNDLELVIKAVETNGAFGPHDQVKYCSVSGAACSIDEDCPAGQICVIDKAMARENRFALAATLANLQGASNGDESDEEIANVAALRLLPSLEVTKRARCADSGQTEFTTQPIDALIGSTVEFELAIENTGNQDLEVTLADVLEEIGGQSALAGCQVLCDTLSASLTSPRRGLVDFAVTFANASAPPICGGIGNPDCLNGEFFFLSCDPPFPEVSFLESINSGTSAVLGTLLGASLSRSDNECTVVGGDRVVLRFRARVGPTPENETAFCSAFVDGDCRNSITVTGTAVGDTAVLASDLAGTPDTEQEIQNNNTDDNRVVIDVLCRGMTFSKFVGFPGVDGSFVTGATELVVPSVPPGGFVDLEYIHIVDNVGETDENITIVDSLLCDDIEAVQAMHPGGVSFTSCPLCTVPPGGQVGPFLLTPAGGTRAESCVIRFSQQVALRKFLTLDNNREPCNDNDPGLSGDDCYRNCASASSTATNLGTICRPPADTIVRSSFTTVCNSQCQLMVHKQVRCLPDCTSTGLGPEAGWIEDPATLDVAPGACLQYRLIVHNIAVDPNPLCALRFDDLMSDKENFQSGPTNVQIIGRSCTNLTFANAFNWDGNDVICRLNNPLQSNQMMFVLFEAKLNPAAGLNADDTPTNRITLMGASENDCPPQGDPTFSCMDDASVAIEIQGCDLEVTKDVTCDDPRLPNAVFASDIVDALPGSRVGFRVQITNAGQVNQPRVDLTDTLGCPLWFVPNSISADIEGTDVETCICAGGCNALAQVNGLKDLVPCHAGGLAPGETLTLTFEVEVPADFNLMGVEEDCANVITVRGFTDVCAPSTENPCPERTARAGINVNVPSVGCEKAVCADLLSDGLCDDDAGLGLSNDLMIEGDGLSYPLSLIYQFTVSNTGETDLSDARICDALLIADLTSGIPDVELGACVLNPGTGCGSVGPLGNGDVGDPPSSASVTCSVKFVTETAYKAFAILDSDGRQVCYTNRAVAEGDADSANLCARGPVVTVDSDGCEARVCIEGTLIPTVSEWGMVILTLLLLTAAKVHFGRLRAAA